MNNRRTNDCLKWLVAIIMILSAAMAHAANDYIVAPTGGDITGAALSAKLVNGNVTLQSSQGKNAGSGNVIINDVVSWNTNSTLTLIASNNIGINANITASGNTAGLLISPNTANGGEQPGGNGSYSLGNGSSVTLSGATPALTIAGINYTVINNLGVSADAATPPASPTLQSMSATANLTKNFALGSNIDATATATWNSGAGFTPIGNSNNNFTGTLDGLGHTVINLNIHQTGVASYIGLFGYTWGRFAVRNLGLVNVSVSGDSNVGGLAGLNAGVVNSSYVTGNVNGFRSVGLLIGNNLGPVNNSYAVGNVSGNTAVGGLIGIHTTVNGSEIVNASCAMGSVNAPDGSPSLIGGLVGDNEGVISNCCALNSVNGSTDRNNGSSWVGGLVGRNGDDNTNASISNSYAIGAVQGLFYVGGLAGGSNNPSSISNSYSTGSVIGTLNVGGLLGYSHFANVQNSYWNTTTSGQANSAGGIGLTGAQMQTASNFAGFNFTSAPGAAGWVIIDVDGTLNNAGGAKGATSPLLAAEYSTTIKNAHQLQLMAMAPAVNYAMGNDIDASSTAGGSDVWGSAGFAPVGIFKGGFDGRGHVIRNLTINQPTATNVGLFGNAGTGAVIKNIGLIGGSVSGGNNVGALVGYLNGSSVNNSFTTGSVTGTGNSIGGLVGNSLGNDMSSISNSYAMGNVTGNNDVGGLIGYNGSGIGHADIVGSYATADVSGNNQVGGLVGHLLGSGSGSSTVSNCYATGRVSGSSNVGGLAGQIQMSGIGKAGINVSYAAGRVTGTSGNIGGLVGLNTSGSVGSSYWNTTTSGQGFSAGGIGLSGKDMLTAKNFMGFDFKTPVWVIVDKDGTLNNANDADGATYPMLAAEYSVSITNAHQLQLMAMKPAAAYTLNADVNAAGTSGNDIWSSSGFAPVGGYSAPFSGSFDGQGHVISNLAISQWKLNRVGLFGVVGAGAAIQNTVLSGGAVNGDVGNVGGLAGINYGTVTSCLSSAVVKSARNAFVGGMIGSNNGMVSNSQTSGNVSGIGGFRGGIAGVNNGTISGCNATGVVTGQGGYSGQLVGNNNGTIK